MDIIQKMIVKEITINNKKHTLVLSGEEFLLDVIRKKIHLTGTKSGCRKNQCGICSVILNGKVVRSCTIQMNRVPDNSTVLTIEGIGTPDNLHPIQLAWIKHGAAQCGICSPGFIVSSYALLQQNLNPTREEVREWFRVNRNICRCTGYKPLVDAVMDAAAVLRGEMDVSDLQFKERPDGTIFGTDYPRPTAIAKVTGTLEYGADVGAKMGEGTLQLALTQAKVSHAKILSIDTSEAEKMPGVAAVLTHKDIKGTNRIDGLMSFDWTYNDGFDRPILCDEKIFQFGDAIAIVCADTVEHARAASDKVQVEIEELPAYLNAQDATKPDAIRIHPESPNIFFEQPLIKGPDPEPIFANAPYVVEHEYYSQRVAHMAQEPDVGFGYYDEEGRVTIHSKSVAVFVHRYMIAAALGLEEDKLRIVQNHTGGTFGYKLSPTIEGILGVAVMATGKPCYLEFDMAQHITYTGKRSPFFFRSKLACDEKGKMLALDYDVLGDHGAYSEFGDLLLTKVMQFHSAGYNLPSIRGFGRMAFTNHAYGAAMRAYGSPQAFFAFESLADEMAEKIGMDPFEFRYQNLYDNGATTPTGQTPDVFVMKKLFDMIRPRYEEACKIRDEKNKGDGKIKRGVGISIGIYCCADAGHDTCDVGAELREDGKIAFYHTWEDHGQGADIGALASAHEALKPLKVKPEDIVMISNDTVHGIDSGYAAGSRSQIMVGNAIYAAAHLLMDAMRKEDGSYRTYDEMKNEGIETFYIGNHCIDSKVTPFNKETMQFDPYIAYMYNATISEVDVNLSTGETKVARMTGAYDVGKLANETVVKGQAYGGMMMCIGMALSEEFEDFKEQNTLAKCGFPTIDVIPDEIDLMFLQTHRENSFFGCSGCGEAVTAGVHPAVTNAIANATGARLYAMPAYPERVLKAINNK